MLPFIAVLVLSAPGLAAGSRPRSDLLVMKLHGAPHASRAGSAFEARAVVENLGNGASARSSVGFYLSRDGRRSHDDRRLGGAALGKVGPGRAARLLKRLALPAALAPGSYRLIACADATRRLRELEEANNCLASRSPLTLGAGTPAPPAALAQAPAPSPAAAPEAPAPAAPVTEAPAGSPAAVSLSSPSDGAYLAGAAPTFAGTGSRSSFVTVYLRRGGTLVETLEALPADGGAWSATPSPGLQDGAYTVEADATGPLGDLVHSGPRSFTVDTVDPVAAIALDPATPNGPGGAYATVPGIDVTADDANLASVACTLDGAPAPLAPVPGSTHGAEGTLAASGTGDHTASCTARDRAGRTTTATRSFAVQGIAPAVTLVTPPDFTTDTTPAFSGGTGTAPGDDPGVTLKIYAGAVATGSPVRTIAATVAGAGWTATGSPALLEGVYTAQAEQSNTLGGVGRSAARTFTVDTSAPAPTIAHPAGGASTNDSTPALDGAAGNATGDSSAVTVRIYNGSGTGGTLARTLSATASSGAWATSPSAALPDGTYTAQAQQQDAAGNTGTSAAVTFRVDTAAPSPTLAHPLDGSSTNDATPAFDGAAGTATGDSATVRVKVYAGSSTGGALVQTVTATASGGGWSVTPSTALADGTYTAQAEQSDGAGNVGRSVARTFTVDTTAPSVTLTHPANGDSTTDTTPAFDGTAGTASGDLAAITVKIYSGSTATGSPARTLSATASGGSWSATPSTALAGGNWTAVAEQPDGTGNTGSSTSHTFTIETPTPTVTLAHPTAGSTTGDQYPTFDGSAGTGTGDSSTVTVRVYSGTSATGTAVQTLTATRNASTGAWSVQATVALPVGSYIARAEQANNLGGVGQSAAVTFSSPAVMLAAGDIASCTQSGDSNTASLLGANASDVVAPLGDNAYESGTASEFTNCYGPTWGAFKAKTRPAAGNHDYYNSAADGSPYFSYFGAAAGTAGQGWYSYDLGAWHVVVLNTNDGCTIVRCSVGSAQVQWLQSDLASHGNQCTLAYFHHPRFSSGANGGTTEVQALWTALYDAGADLVLNGHDHDYERFAPQDPGANADPARGIREFVVGTGGYTEYEFGTNFEPNSQIRNDDTHGVLQLVLRPSGYSWTFLPVAGKTFTDSGSGSCH